MTIEEIHKEPMKTISGIPISDRHAKSKIGICKTKSKLTLLEAAVTIVLNDDISALEEDSEAMIMSVGLMATWWDITPEYARKLVLDVAATKPNVKLSA